MSKHIDDAIRSSFLAFAIKAFGQLHPGKELVVHAYMSCSPATLTRSPPAKGGGS